MINSIDIASLFWSDSFCDMKGFIPLPEYPSMVINIFDYSLLFALTSTDMHLYQGVVYVSSGGSLTITTLWL